MKGFDQLLWSLALTAPFTFTPSIRSRVYILQVLSTPDFFLMSNSEEKNTHKKASVKSINEAINQSVFSSLFKQRPTNVSMHVLVLIDRNFEIC